MIPVYLLSFRSRHRETTREDSRDIYACDTTKVTVHEESKSDSMKRTRYLRTGVFLSSFYTVQTHSYDLFECDSSFVPVLRAFPHQRAPGDDGTVRGMEVCLWEAHSHAITVLCPFHDDRGRAEVSAW